MLRALIAVAIVAAVKSPATATDPAGGRTVAITQDYLVGLGGSERVVLELLRMWPSAPVYTVAHRAGDTYPEFAPHQIHQSPLGRAPGGAVFRALAPLYPLAMRALGTLPQGLVISSTSGWGHRVRRAPGSIGVVYCHTVSRWVHRPGEFFARPAAAALVAPLAAALRGSDVRAMRAADVLVTNSQATRERARAAYGCDSEVVHPPVDVERFEPTPRGERLLVLSRLHGYKRIDLAIEAANRAGLGLDIVGDGPAAPRLRELAGPTVTFHGNLGDDAVTELVQSCLALCLPAAEDFGIAPVEANAAGKPVVAFRAGGVLETQKEGETAVFFRGATAESLLDALRQARDLDTAPERIAEHAARFSGASFRKTFADVVRRAVARANPAR